METEIYEHRSHRSQSCEKALMTIGDLPYLAYLPNMLNWPNGSLWACKLHTCESVCGNRLTVWRLWVNTRVARPEPLAASLCSLPTTNTKHAHDPSIDHPALPIGLVPTHRPIALPTPAATVDPPDRLDCSFYFAVPRQWLRFFSNIPAIWTA